MKLPARLNLEEAQDRNRRDYLPCPCLCTADKGCSSSGPDSQQGAGWVGSAFPRKHLDFTGHKCGRY